MSMGEKKNPQEIDRWIDEAIGEYGKAEPRDGIEARVLARLDGAHREPRRVWHWWGALALGTAALLAVAAVWFGQAHRGTTQAREATPTRTSIATTKTPQPPPEQVEPGNVGSHRSTSSKREPSSMNTSAQAKERQAQADSSPKLDQFPSPQPLSEQERILMSYVANHPATAALVAEARAEALKRDLEDEAAEVANGNAE
jgi:FtsZ-interacting cell division protein ZipA